MTLTHQPTTTGVELPGLAGDRTGGFLAALGLLALLHHDGRPARLSWSNTWNPAAHLHDLQVPLDELPAYVHALLTKQEPAPAPWDPQIQPTRLSQPHWQTLARATPMAASVQPHSSAAWLATASETGGKPGCCAQTRLFTLSGEQRPGKIIATLHRHVTSRPPLIIHEALFGPGRYHHAAHLSMGFDPAGVTDAATHGKGAPPAVIPALELLAVYGLPWWPVFDGHTSGLYRAAPKAGAMRLCWPLWRQPLGPARADSSECRNT